MMRASRQLVAAFAWLAAVIPTAAHAQAQAGEWVSYRDAYRAMVQFEKYGGPKNLLQSQLQVQSRDHAGLGDGAQLTLTGRVTQLNLPLDALGRTVFPLQKAAYDENAALVLNRKGMPFVLRPQVTIAPRADGEYDAAILRTACAQALGFVRYVDASQRARQCTGVRFVFPKKESAGARLRHADGAEQALPVTAGAAFTGDPDEGFPIVTWRFGAGAERAQLITYNAPLAIVPIFE
ncbi:hypothetical protein ASC93_28415 [Massilia sp. Root335]|jgi:hypothetical protein|nr:hypothetical protein ASC93_28415 [Massilia sp. Root335]